jgi:hypothetical protein
MYVTHTVPDPIRIEATTKGKKLSGGPKKNHLGGQLVPTEKHITTIKSLSNFSNSLSLYSSQAAVSLPPETGHFIYVSLFFLKNPYE